MIGPMIGPSRPKLSCPIRVLVLAAILAGAIGLVKPVRAQREQAQEPLPAALGNGEVKLQTTENPPTREAPGGAGTATPTIGVSTAAPDGSIIHVVKEGETLASISEAYDVSLLDLMALNGLTQTSVIYPGDRLTIHGADRTPTLPATATNTSRPPTATRRPTYTPRPTQTETQNALAAGQEATSAPEDSPTGETSLATMTSDPLLLAVVALGILGIVMIVVGSLIKSRSGLKH